MNRIFRTISLCKVYLYSLKTRFNVLCDIKANLATALHYVFLKIKKHLLIFDRCLCLSLADTAFLINNKTYTARL